jgi:hypothetical protein
LICIIPPVNGGKSRRGQFLRSYTFPCPQHLTATDADVRGARQNIMKTSLRKILVVSVISLLLLAVGLVYVLWAHRLPDLSEAICQPSDLGELYHFSNWPSAGVYPELGEIALEAYSVDMVDLQLTYTVLNCKIYRFADEIVAHRAFENVCVNRIDSSVKVGEEVCAFVGHAPRNLAFRRDEYLVLMSGDINVFPAEAMDKRLR